MQYETQDDKYAKTGYQGGFMSTSILQNQWDKAQPQSVTLLRKAFSYVWRALQLHGNMTYKTGALEWLSWMSSSERAGEKLQGPVTTEGTTLNSPPTVSRTVIWNGFVCQHLQESLFLLQFVCVKWVSSPKCTALAGTRDLKSTDQFVLQECACACAHVCHHLWFFYVCVCITDVDELHGCV